jgi:NAD(P)-dependent dehydrogenase (short-subunit alcohol dehydrogenase family)
VRAAAFELGGAGIRINAVRPGLTLPPERAAAPELAAMVEVYVGETPLGRVGEPDDVARVVRFLAGPESGWVTGQTFSADGGLDQGKGPDPMDAMYGKDAMDRIRAGKPG